MSFQSARQFIVDFYTNPILRMKIYKIQNKKINHAEQISKILMLAKNNGYKFSLFELIKAVRFKQKVQTLHKNELAHIFGGACLNYDEFNKANRKLKSIEQMLSIN